MLSIRYLPIRLVLEQNGWLTFVPVRRRDARRRSVSLAMLLRTTVHRPVPRL